VRRIGRVVAGIAGWALAAGGGTICLGSAAMLRRSRATFNADLFAVCFYLLTTIAGVALIRLAWPGIFGRVARRAIAILRKRELIFNPLVHGLAIYVAGTLLAAVTGQASILVVMVSVTVYSVASPALMAFRPRWWLHALVSLAVGLSLLVALTGTGEAVSRQHYGDDAMVMLFPVMVYPVALVVSLALHLGWRARSRRQAAAAAVAADAPTTAGATTNVAQQKELR
jgi:hypothetical protein